VAIGRTAQLSAVGQRERVDQQDREQGLQRQVRPQVCTVTQRRPHALGEDRSPQDVEEVRGATVGEADDDRAVLDGVEHGVHGDACIAAVSSGARRQPLQGGRSMLAEVAQQCLVQRQVEVLGL
jgi:hypothetical protein